MTLHSIEAYDFELPEELIAQEPLTPRDASRLLVVHRKEGRWEHRKFTDLPSLLNEENLMVANNSRVLKARLLGRRLRQEKGQWIEGGRIEFVILEKLGPNMWEGLFHASAQYVPGLRFVVPTPSGKNIHGVLIRGSADSPTGTVVAEFDQDPVEADAGEIPLPHYIQRKTGSSTSVSDEESYQTVYSKVLGSAAAPTAGLHFTDRILDELRAKGIGWDEVTLNVGLGTFRPVKAQDLRDHVMHEESFEVLPQTATHINQWKKKGGKVLAVGTTSVRALESAWVPGAEKSGTASGEVQPGMKKTSLFIRPGAFEFHVVDHLLTNFHLPKSTLLILVSTFAGRELMMDVYRDAVKEKYRFFSYGDAMLIL
jgi:S-adenosylmethionine:tRNA ribosyltransferase-isomerase